MAKFARHGNKQLSLNKVSKPPKTKSRKHKSKNSASTCLLPRPSKSERKGWLGFAERCRRMSANPIKALQQQTSVDDSHKTHLSNALAKWRLLNLSTQFVALQRELGQDVHTLAQIIYNRGHIAKTLLKYLVKEEHSSQLDEQLTAGDLQQQANNKSNSTEEVTKETSAAEDQNLDCEDPNFVSSNFVQRSAEFFIEAHKNDTPAEVNEEDSTVLEPLLHLIEALASDIPQHFYEHHFYEFLPHIVGYSSSPNPAQIEQVFSCLLNMLVVMRGDIVKDPYKLYTSCFAELLSTNRPWYINDIAAQTFSFLVRKIPEKELFFYKVFKRLRKDSSQMKGLGKLLTAVMKSNTLNRVHSVTPEILSIMFHVLDLKSVPTKFAMEVFINGLKGLVFFVSAKNEAKPWEEFWKEDSDRVWGSVWRQLDSLVAALPLDNIPKDEPEAEGETCTADADSGPEEECDEQELATVMQKGEDKTCKDQSAFIHENVKLKCVLDVAGFLVNFKRGSLLTDSCVAYDKLEPIIKCHTSLSIGDAISDILTDLLKSAKHQACSDEYDATRPLQIRRNRIIGMMFNSSFPASVIFSFARGTSSLVHFNGEILPKLLRYLDRLVGEGTDETERISSLSLVMDILMHHQPPVTSGVQICQWQKFSLTFGLSDKEESENLTPQTVPELIESLLCGGVAEDLGNVEALLTAVLCLPHVGPLDQQLMSSYLAGILSDALSYLEVSPKTVMAVEALTPKDRPVSKRKTARGAPQEDDDSKVVLPELDLNVDLALDQSTRLLLYLVDVIVEAMALMLSQRDFLATLTGMNIINILREHPQHRENEHLLRAIDIYVTIASEAPDFDDDLIVNPISEQTFCDLYKILAPALASTSPQTRMLVTHILSLFPLRLPPPPKGVIHQQNLFEIMYQMSSLTVTALNYNDLLRLMENLKAERVEMHSPVSGMCAQAPILFALGLMYLNLNPVMGNSVTFIAGFAKKLRPDDFWNLWFSKLKLVTHSTLAYLRHQDSNDTFCTNESLMRVHEYIISHQGSGKLSRRVDHATVRNLMWKTMIQIPETCAVRNKDIVGSFFEFMEEEMQMTDFSIAPTANLEVGTASSMQHDANKEEEEEEEENDDEEDIDDADDDHNTSKLGDSDGAASNKKDDPKTRKNRGSKLILNTLCNYLTLFSKFYNLKTIHLSQDLEKIFMDLLVHPSTRVQSLALNCVFGYKKRAILPYKESLTMIQSDAAFKRGVMALRIDSSGREDDNCVAEEHREELMPLYIRLLFGKMLTSVGKNTTGKNKIIVRKATVMRLLAGIRDEESKYLMHLAFEILEPHLEKSCCEIVDSAFAGMDATKVIPLKRMYGILSSLDSMIQYLGNLLPTRQSYFLKVILLLLSHSTVLKDHTPSVHSCYKNLLKKIKHRAMNELLKFYDSFQNYQWTSDELDAVFKCVVWPALPKLATEGVINIHPVLKLFTKWSENEFFYPLFVKHHPEDESLSPLPYMFSLATQPKCRVSVINYILNMVHNIMGQNDAIVNTEEQQQFGKFKKNKFGKRQAVRSKPKVTEPAAEGAIVPMVECDNLLPVEEPEARLLTTTQVTYGTKILLPHTRSLTSCMHTLLLQLARKSGRDTQLVRILCLITQFVCDADEGDKLLAVIIPMLGRKKTDNNEVIDHLLVTCSHLLPISKHMDRFCVKMLPLFLSTTTQSSRSNLCSVYESVGKEHERYGPLAHIMSGLNSWETTYVDSMDVGARLKSYRKLVSLLQTTDHFDRTLYQFTLNQTCYDIHHVSDVTLQESSVKTFSELIKSCMRFWDKNHEEVSHLMGSILTLIKRGIAASSDTVHCAYLKLLGSAVQYSAGNIKGLADLANINSDIDFFNNISHLQMARRALAQNRLIQGFSSGKYPLKVDTIETYVWPLVCRYLTHQHYAHETGLIHATFKNLVDVVARLSWNTYLSGLKFFLNRLKDDSEKNRLILKVVGIILDGFHEDVSGLVFRRGPKAASADAKLAKKKDVSASEEKAAEKEGSADAESVKEKPASTDGISEVSGKPTEGVSQPEQPSVVPQNSHSYKVYNALVRDIIPGIKRVFESRSESASFHKLNKSKRANDEDIKKIPLALPLVKLLKKFPERVLDANLSNVFYQLMCFLRSHVPYIRREAREMILQILKEVGGKYLPALVMDLRANLRLGFQKFVLIHMVKTLLVSCTDMFKSSHVCRCLNEVVELCTEELFANKGVEYKGDDREKDAEPVDEAKGDKKSFAIMGVLGRFIQVQRLQDVMGPIKEVLATTQRKYVVTLAERCLTHFMLGLEANETITLNEKLIFAYGILTEKIMDFKQDQPVEVSPLQSVYDTPDRMLLEPEPKRIKISAKTSSATNSYVLVNFSVGLLFKLLQRNTLSRDNMEHNNMLDPFVSLLINFLHSSHPEVSISCLKCFVILARFPLPSFKEKIETIVAQMFVLLNKYNSSELEAGLLFNMVQVTFRCLTSILKYIDYYTFKPSHMRVLLVYMKENLMNHAQQNTVFSLLQAIIDRKLDAPELKDIMAVIMKFVVTQESVPVLDQSRRLYFEYVTKYPTNVQKFKESLRYYIENLSYSTVQGRISVCLMLNNFIANVPGDYLNQKLIRQAWVSLLLCIIREESDECRKQQRFTLSQVFLNTVHKQFLIKESLLLVRRDLKVTRTADATNTQLGCLSLMAFLESGAKNMPPTILSDVLPAVVQHLQPDNFEPIPAEEGDSTADSQQLCIDKALFALLQLFQKLFDKYQNESKWASLVGEAWSHVRHNLLYNELDVRLITSALIGKLFASCPLEEKLCPSIAATTPLARSLVKDLVEQFRCSIALENKFKQLCLSTVRNLIYMIRQSEKVPLITPEVATEKKELSNAMAKSLCQSIRVSKELNAIGASAHWVVSLVSKVAVEDMNTKRTVRREAAFNLMAGVVLVLGDDLDTSDTVLQLILTEIVRETKQEENDEDTGKSVAVVGEVAEMIKEKIGWEKYGEMLHTAERSLDKRRIARKANKKERLIRNPELAQAERERKNLNHKLSLKRKRLEGVSVTKKKKSKKNDD